jgi:hypothetical protein
MHRPDPTPPCKHEYHDLPVKKRLRGFLAVCPRCNYVCQLILGHIHTPETAIVSRDPIWHWRITIMQGGTIPGSNQLFN